VEKAVINFESCKSSYNVATKTNSELLLEGTQSSDNSDGGHNEWTRQSHHEKGLAEEKSGHLTWNSYKKRGGLHVGHCTETNT
jgi:hypothetical protein